MHLSTRLISTPILCGPIPIMAFVLAAAAQPPVTYAAEFIRLGSLASPTTAGSGVVDLSLDGSVVVGTSTQSGISTNAVYRWTRGSGMVSVSDLSDSSSPSGIAASQNGTSIRWTTGTGLAKLWREGEGLIDLQGFTPSLSSAFSADGELLVGTLGGNIAVWNTGAGTTTFPYPAGFNIARDVSMSSVGEVIGGVIGDAQAPCIGCGEPFIAAVNGAIMPLGLLEGRNRYELTGISADGGVLAGISFFSGVNPTRQDVWRWTASAGLVMIEAATAELDHVAVSGRSLSADGSVIIMNRYYPQSTIDRFQAARWTESSGLMLIPGLPGADYSVVADMSADGAMIVGASTFGSDRSYWLWTEEAGPIPLSDLLNQQGIGGVLANWTFDARSRLRISGDGRAIAGHAKNPDGVGEAFVIYLDPINIPEPSTLILGALTVGGAALFRAGSRRVKVAA